MINNETTKYKVIYKVKVEHNNKNKKKKEKKKKAIKQQQVKKSLELFCNNNNNNKEEEECVVRGFSHARSVGSGVGRVGCGVGGFLIGLNLIKVIYVCVCVHCKNMHVIILSITNEFENAHHYN